jgi:hypothetical protein
VNRQKAGADSVQKPVKMPIRQSPVAHEVFDFNLAECIISPEHLTFSIEFETQEQAQIAISSARKMLESLGLEMKEC